MNRTATTHAEVCAVLDDPRFQVAEASPAGARGTIAWLRASVSRFVNGPVHEHRRALVQRLLADIDPRELRTDTHRATREILDRSGTVDVAVAGRVPIAALAARLGAADPAAVADAVPICSGGYFPGSDDAAVRAADVATADLVELLGPGEDEVVVARIAVLVQGSTPGAELIAAVLRVLPEAGEWSTDALLAEVLRHDPPVRIMRRETAGEAVTCDIAQANRDPAVVTRPDDFDPGRIPPAPSLTFGHGSRACPGAAHAVASAAGVIDAVREHSHR